MASKKKVIVRVLLVLLLAAAVVATLLYVRAMRKPKELVLSGSLEARTVNVGSLYGGRVSRVLTDEGQPVTAGQVIVELETDPIDRQIAEQTAAIAAAEAQLSKAINGNRPQEIAQARVQADYDVQERARYARLYREGIVSKELYDEKLTQAETSSEQLRLLEAGSRQEDIAAQRATVDQQKAHLATLQRQRVESTIRSSVAGVVQSFKIRPGDLIAMNQGVAEILESDQLWVRIYVPETLLGAVRMGAPVKVFVDTFPNRSFAGHIAQISSQGEYTPRNVQTEDQRAEEVFGVKIVVDSDPALKAGMAATVDLGIDSAGNGSGSGSRR